LREHEHTRLWPLPSQLDRRPQTIISMPGRHVHISDHDRRTVRETPPQQIVGVAGLSDDLEPASVSSRAIPSRSNTSSSPITTRSGSDTAQPYRADVGFMVVRHRAAAPGARWEGRPCSRTWQSRMYARQFR